MAINWATGGPVGGGSQRLQAIAVDEVTQNPISVESAGGMLKAVMVVWQPSTLSYVKLSADSSGNLNTAGGGGGGGGTQYAQGTVNASPTGTVAMGMNPSNALNALNTDVFGNLNVNLAAGSISGGNAAAAPTGALVPTSAGYTGWNSAGNLVGVSLTNALPVQPGTGATWGVTQSGTWNIASVTNALPAGGNVIGGVTQSGTWSTQTLDGTGQAINSLSAGTGMNGLMVAIGATNYVISSANSTTTQLVAGATFTGTIEGGNSEPAISIIMTADQPGILTVNQYITSSAGTIVNSVQFVTVAVTGGNCFSRSFTLNGNFVNVTWKNTGGSSTTTLNINTAYGNIPATTNLLNGPVALNEVNGSPISLGQTTMAASLPVAIASNQAAIPVTLSSTTITGTVAATQSGTWTTGRTWALSNASDSVTTVPSGTQTVTGTVTANQGGAPWSDNISQWGGVATSLGQKASASSVPVALASDGIGASSGNPMFISGTINASSAAAAGNSPPQYTDGTSNPFSQDLNGYLRTLGLKDIAILEALQAIILELRVQNTILHQTLNSRDDLDLLRADADQLGSMINTIN